MANETRRTLLSEIVAARAATAAELAGKVGISRQGVSKHMAVLVGAGLASRERRWRSVFFKVRSDALFGALAWLSQVGAAEAEALREGRTRAVRYDLDV